MPVEPRATGAVFLSYASQDAEAAKRICDALRAAGVEVWFDQSELRGGDAWDAKIRRQIKDCALFVPVISANTNARAEGYFRLEWKLAVDRSHLMADDVPFLFPIVVGDVSDTAARVPDKFREVQWTRVRLDESPAELAARVARLLQGEQGPSFAKASESRSSRTGKTGFEKWWWLIFPIVGLSVPIITVLMRPARQRPEPPAAAAPVPPAVSEAWQLAQRAMAMSVDKYNSTADDYATAEGLLKRALELEQNDAEIWAISSMLHTNIRTRGFDHAPARREWARRDAERAVKLDPNSQNALFALGRTQRDTDPVAAEATFKKLLSLNPENADAMGQLGWLYDADGRVEEAIKLYDRVLTLDPAGAPLTQYVRFLLFFHYSRFVEAEQAIRRSVEMDPSANSSAGLVMLLLTAKGGTEESARVLAAVPAAFRNEPRIVWVGALAQLCRRDPEAVLWALQRLQSDYIQDNWFAGPKAYFAGLAHAMAGRTEAARVAWQSALAIVDTRLKETPDNPTLRLCRGQLLAWLGQTDEARREARLLDEMRAGRPSRSWFGSTALVHAAVGDADKALPLLEQLMSVDNSTNVGWPLTRALLRLDPRWDKLRSDPRFQALCAEPAAAPSSLSLSPSTLSVADSKSVAVLAFANLSDDKANEYFSDGISEELLNVLAKVPGLKVSARTSAFYFKGKEVPVPEIARQLGVAYVVEGSVRKQGDKVRITAQLIKAADGFHVWSDTFTRDLKDIFAVQDEIAGLIAKSLKLKLGAGDSARDKSTDVAAWQLYLDGRRAWNLRTMEGYREAETLFQRAIALDARFARAYAALADVWQIRAIDTEGETFSQRWRTAPSAIKSRALIDKALEIDPHSAEAYASLGMNLQLGWEEEPALQAYRRAIELNPNYATAHQWLGLCSIGVGELDEAQTELALAAELDPLSHRILSDYAKVLICAGRPAQALAVSHRALAVQPGAVQAVLQKARALALLGRPLEASAVVEEMDTKDLNPRLRVDALATLVIAEQPEAIRRLIGDVDAMPASMMKFASLVALGRIDEAFANLNSSIIGNGWSLIEAAYGRLYEPIRDDARFQRMIESSGRAEYFRRAQAWRAAHPPEKPAAK